MAPDPAPLSVAFGGRTLKISSLDKVLYPATGTTKGEVLDYYVSVAPAILPQLRDRAVTRVRFPHGVAAGGFFEKNAPAGTPKWIERVPLPADGVAGSDSTTIRWPLLGEIAALVWAVNLGSLELHTPQWRIGHGCPREPAFPDRLVIDLDPGPGTGLAECSVC